MDGKAEEAAKIVAEDSKVLLPKQQTKVKKFEITSVSWSSGFTEARVTAELDVAHPQGLLFPEGSFWKLEKGQWVWWIPAEYRKKVK